MVGLHEVIGILVHALNLHVQMYVDSIQFIRLMLALNLQVTPVADQIMDGLQVQ